MMYWKSKARIQKVVSSLPDRLSGAMHYWIQRHFGGLRDVSPISRLNAGVEAWKRIQVHGYEPSDKIFFEVGTGRAPMMPLAFWLMGAKSCITVDLNPYMQSEIIEECLKYISLNQQEVRELFDSLLRQNRPDELLHLFRSTGFSCQAFLNLCHIDYQAPGNAAKTSLATKSVHFHTSYTVLEHIPQDTLTDILKEGNRIIRDDGLFVYMIDYSDHFSHSDTRISSINFLQYSDSVWEKYAGNRFGYVNRLRHDDIMGLFESAGHSILSNEPDRDVRVLKMIESKQLELDSRFREKPEDILETLSAWFVTKKA